jgi:hypothetical protein
MFHHGFTCKKVGNFAGITKLEIVWGAAGVKSLGEVLRWNKGAVVFHRLSSSANGPKRGTNMHVQMGSNG